MSDPIYEVKGARSTVQVYARGDGYAWGCDACGRSAGLPAPELSARATEPLADVVLPNGTTMTADEFVMTSATRHADQVCAGRR